MIPDILICIAEFSDIKSFTHLMLVTHEWNRILNNSWRYLIDRDFGPLVMKYAELNGDRDWKLSDYDRYKKLSQGASIYTIDVNIIIKETSKPIQNIFDIDMDMIWKNRIKLFRGDIIQISYQPSNSSFCYDGKKIIPTEGFSIDVMEFGSKYMDNECITRSLYFDHKQYIDKIILKEIKKITTNVRGAMRVLYTVYAARIECIKLDLYIQSTLDCDNIINKIKSMDNLKVYVDNPKDPLIRGFKLDSSYSSALAEI